MPSVHALQGKGRGRSEEGKDLERKDNGKEAKGKGHDTNVRVLQGGALRLGHRSGFEVQMKAKCHG